LPDVLADHRALVQILVNLLTNAVKYTPDGGHVVLGASAGGGLVRFEVKDDGIGIRPADQNQIFAYFSRAGGKHSLEVHGAGIGLALTKALVEEMSGEIGVASDAGKGSVFFFTIPVAHRGEHDVF
ncbi:hypothetical protein IIA16_02535, partial [bacterium]|nr:hypothetical protein [bacterium]